MIGLQKQTGHAVVQFEACLRAISRLLQIPFGLHNKPSCCALCVTVCHPAAGRWPWEVCKGVRRSLHGSRVRTSGNRGWLDPEAEASYLNLCIGCYGCWRPCMSATCLWGAPLWAHLFAMRWCSCKMPRRQSKSMVALRVLTDKETAISWHGDLWLEVYLDLVAPVVMLPYVPVTWCLYGLASSWHLLVSAMAAKESSKSKWSDTTPAGYLELSWEARQLWSWIFHNFQRWGDRSVSKTALLLNLRPITLQM